MKKLLSYVVMAVLISGWTACSQAMELVPVTSFDSSWALASYGTGTGTVTTDGAKANLSAQGAATDYREMDLSKSGTAGVIGMVATLRVDQAFCSTGYCNLFINQYIGKIDNSKIQLQISLQQQNNQNSIEFRIKAKDLTTNVSNVLVKGVFGDLNGGWVNGDIKTVAFARVGSEYWFYLVGYPGLIKIQALENLTPYDSAPNLGAWAGQESSISGSVSDIYLIKE
jgi:hypothetical protein